MRYSIDLSRSSLQIFTSADGLLARLAHDLRLSVGAAAIDVVRDESEATVRAHVRIGALRVDGVMKDGALREGVLSAHDREEILNKMRAEVFGGKGDDALIELEGSLRGDSLSGTLRSPNGRSARVNAKVTTVHDGAEAAPGEHVRGTFEVSLKELAGHDIKGPLGAFRVSDHVRVTFDAHFVPRVES